MEEKKNNMEAQIKEIETKLRHEQKAAQKANLKIEKAREDETGPFWSKAAQEKRAAENESNDALYEKALPHSKDMWKRAKTWHDVLRLGSLVAQGKIASPWYLALTTSSGDNPDFRDDVTTSMMEINERGILTSNSQVGQPLDKSGSFQRAYVEGTGFSRLITLVVKVLNTIPGMVAWHTPSNCMQVTKKCTMRGLGLTYDHGEPFSTAIIGNDVLESIGQWNPTLAERLEEDKELFTFFAFDAVPGRNELFTNIIATLRLLDTFRVSPDDLPKKAKTKANGKPKTAKTKSKKH